MAITKSSNAVNVSREDMSLIHVALLLFNKFTLTRKTVTNPETKHKQYPIRRQNRTNNYFKSITITLMQFDSSQVVRLHSDWSYKRRARMGSINLIPVLYGQFRIEYTTGWWEWKTKLKAASGTELRKPDLLTPDNKTMIKNSSGQFYIDKILFFTLCSSMNRTEELIASCQHASKFPWLREISSIMSNDNSIIIGIKQCRSNCIQVYIKTHQPDIDFTWICMPGNVQNLKQRVQLCHARETKHGIKSGRCNYQCSTRRVCLIIRFVEWF